MKTVFIDWNLIPYAEAWQRQTEWFDGIVRAKAEGEPYENHIIMCEHPHVYTLGRSGKENNMLLSEEQLKAIDATLYHIDRGGDITYHGPGQLVCYPIVNLEEFQLGLKEYVPAMATSLRLNSTSSTWVSISGRLNSRIFFHRDPLVISMLFIRLSSLPNVPFFI